MLYTVFLAIQLAVPGHPPDLRQFEMATIDSCHQEMRKLLDRAAQPDFAEKTGAAGLAVGCVLKFKNNTPGQDATSPLAPDEAPPEQKD